MIKWISGAMMVVFLLAVSATAATTKRVTSFQLCGITGDSIAATLASLYMRQCQVSATSGTTTDQIVALSRAINPSRNVIISAGSNDQPTSTTITKNLDSIRRNVRTSLNIIWIVPLPPAARLAVEKVAAKNHDKSVYFLPGPDDPIHPGDWPKLVADIQALMVP